MLITVATADSFLRPLVKMATETGLERLASALEQVNAPVYVTDAEGVVINFNSACIGFLAERPLLQGPVVCDMEVVHQLRASSFRTTSAQWHRQCGASRPSEGCSRSQSVLTGLG